MAKEEVEYEEGYDLKKVGALILGIILVVIVATMFLGLINIEIPEITIPEITIPETQNQITNDQTAPQEPTQVQIPNNNLRPEYEKYFDFGLSVDDIIDIQNMDCSVFTANGTMSTDPKFTGIFEQRRSEC